jgi:hypothetical protein
MIGTPVAFFRYSLILELVITMSKFVSALTLAFILLTTVAHAGIAIVDGAGTSSGRASNTASYAVNLPTGIVDGSLVVVAIASNTRTAPSAEGYTSGYDQGFNGDANGCFEFYHVWKTGDSTSPVFSRSTTGSDAYAVVALSGVGTTTTFVDTASGTSSASGNRVNLPAITTHNNDDMGVYASCAEGSATFLNPSVGTIAVQQADTSSSVAISTYAQATAGDVGTQATFTDTSLINGSAVMALIAAPAAEGSASSSP